MNVIEPVKYQFEALTVIFMCVRQVVEISDGLLNALYWNAPYQERAIASSCSCGSMCERSLLKY